MKSNKQYPLIERLTISGAFIQDITTYLTSYNNDFSSLHNINPNILEDYKSNSLPNDIEYNQYKEHIPKYSFPTGLKTAKFNNLQETQIISFCLVNQHNNQHTHCSSLIFYENYRHGQEAFSLTKAITLSSSKDIYTIHKQILNFIYNYLKRHKNNNSNSKSSNTNINDLLPFYISFILNCLNIPNTKIISKQLSYLIYNTTNNSIDTSNSKSFLNFYIDDYTNFPYKDYSLTILFNVMHIDDLIFIYKCMLLEYKIILIFSNYENINIVIQSLLAILFPFKWRFPITSYCLKETHVLLDSPFPMVIGVHVNNINSVHFRLNKNQFNNETVVYDLIEKKFLYKNNVDEINDNSFTVKITNQLKSELLFIKSEYLRYKTFENSNGNFEYEGNDIYIDNNYEIKKLFDNNDKLCNLVNKNFYFNIKIISVFSLVIINFIKDIRNCCINSNNNNNISEFNYDKEFDVNEFLSKFDFYNNASLLSFMKLFTKTLMFQSFIKSYIRKKDKLGQYRFIDSIINNHYESSKMSKRKLKTFINEIIKDKTVNYYKVSDCFNLYICDMYLYS